MTCRSQPSFFKILFDPSCHHLPLPATFVSKHLENRIPENPILRSSNGGFSWQLKIKQIGGEYCFADGWINVVKDIQLGYADFLVFRLVDPSTFNVSIFSPSGCEKDLNSKNQVTNDKNVVHEEEDEEDVHENDEDDESEDEEEGGDDDDDEEEEEENDEDDDDEEEDGSCEVEDDDEDDGKEEEDDVDGDIDGDDGDPFFMTVLTKTHQTLMRLPAEFLRLAGIDGERTITMKNPDDKEWQMNLRSEKNNKLKRYYLASGWRDFWRSNELSEGDKCLFKFIKSEDKLCLARVTRKKAQSVAKDLQTDAKKRKRTNLPGDNRVNRENDRVESLPGEHRVNPENDRVEVVERSSGRQLRQKSRVVYF